MILNLPRDCDAPSIRIPAGVPTIRAVFTNVADSQDRHGPSGPPSSSIIWNYDAALDRVFSHLVDNGSQFPGLLLPRPLSPAALVGAAQENWCQSHDLPVLRSEATDIEAGTKELLSLGCDGFWSMATTPQGTWTSSSRPFRASVSVFRKTFSWCPSRTGRRSHAWTPGHMLGLRRPTQRSTCRRRSDRRRHDRRVPRRVDRLGPACAGVQQPLNCWSETADPAVAGLSGQLMTFRQGAGTLRHCGSNDEHISTTGLAALVSATFVAAMADPDGRTRCGARTGFGPRRRDCRPGRGPTCVQAQYDQTGWSGPH